MAHVLILGGGFAGVVAAKALAGTLGPEHRISLISRNHRFVFSPALVRLALGECEIGDISLDLREAMLSRRVQFLEGQVARIDPYQRTVRTIHSTVEGDISYDYLIFALGRRLATDTGAADAIFLRKSVGRGEPATVRQGRFWRWAKRIHEMYFQHVHR